MIVWQNGETIDDPWRVLDVDSPVPAIGQIVVPFERIVGADAETLLHSECGLGVTVGVDDDLEQLAPWVARLGLIILEVPVFSDGRPLSSARIIRDQLGFAGDLRAQGDLLPDLYQFMVQVGFTSFAMAAARFAQWQALGDEPDLDRLHMPLSYQTDLRAGLDQCAPIWRQRHRQKRAAA